MARRGNGGNIGPRNVPALSAAAGVWGLYELQEAQGAGIWPSAAARDSSFKNVSLLLTADSASNTQTNKSFLDSSGNALTITPNGNTTQGSFAPYGTLWSNYFSGSGDYLGVASNAAFATGTNSFTIEGWVFLTAYTYGAIFSTWNSSLGTNGIHLGFDNTGKPAFLIGNAGTGGSAGINSATAIPLNTWTHIAGVRNGTTLTLYVNGTSAGTATSSISVGQTAPYVGSYYANSPSTNLITGNVSNVRLVSGTAVYTGAFTPSVTPLTAISGTVLLTCQGNRFVDASASPLTITVNGTPKVTTFSPFNPSVPYAPATIGGSGYFDGNSDYLGLTAPTGLAFGAGSWYLETWVYVAALGGDQMIYDGRPIATNGAYVTLFIQNASNKLDFYTATGDRILSDAALTTGQWYHVVLSKASGTTRMFINGVVQTTTYADSNTYLIGALRPNIGAGGAAVSGYLNGYLAGFNVVTGTGLTSVTVPTAPPSPTTGSQLILNFTNAGIVDSAMQNDGETVDNTQASTTVTLFSNPTIKFDGMGDYVAMPATPSTGLGTADFTIEGWMYANSLGSFGTLVTNRTSATDATTGRFSVANRSAALEFYSGAATVRAAGTISTLTWTHFAVVRTSGVVKLFLNGTQVGADAPFTTSLNADALYVGANGAGTDAFNGYVSQVRVTKGIARYTSNFPVPTAPFPKY